MLSVRRFVAAAAGLAVYAALAAAPAHAQNVALVSKLGGKCLDAEGGTRRGARVIGYPCNGGDNEIYWFNRNGTITQGGYCLDASGGAGRDGDQIVLWDCNGGANQRWRLVGNALVGINGKCIDLKGGGWGNLPFVNQPAILWSCHGGTNQQWLVGFPAKQSKVSGGAYVQPGQLADMRGVPDQVGRELARQSNVVAAGGGNVIAAGGGNVIAAGGGNVIVVSGGNVVAAGGLN